MTKYNKQLHKTNNHSKGVTLVEVLLYVSVVAVVLGAMSAFYAALMQSQVKNTAIQEVELQGMLVADTVTQMIRNAEAVNSPAPGDEAASLSLEMPQASEDPTVFSVTGEEFEIERGSGVAQPLTNERVRVTDVSFENLAREDTPDIIRLTFTISHVNPSNRSEYSFEKSFYASGAVRQP